MLGPLLLLFKLLQIYENKPDKWEPGIAIAIAAIAYTMSKTGEDIIARGLQA